MEGGHDLEEQQDGAAAGERVQARDQRRMGGEEQRAVFRGRRAGEGGGLLSLGRVESQGAPGKLICKLIEN